MPRRCYTWYSRDPRPSLLKEPLCYCFLAKRGQLISLRLTWICYSGEPFFGGLGIFVSAAPCQHVDDMRPYVPLNWRHSMI